MVGLACEPSSLALPSTQNGFSCQVELQVTLAHPTHRALVSRERLEEAEGRLENGLEE